MQIINTPNAPAAIGPYSQAIIANGFLFASGQIPLDPVTMQIVGSNASEQITQVLKNVEGVLTGANLKKENVIKVTMFLKNMADFADVNKIYEEFFGSHKPARSTIEVAKLPKDALVEIEVVAAI